MKKTSRKSCEMVTSFYIAMTSQIDVWPACGCLFFIFPHMLVRVCEIELSHIGKNNGNPDLDCARKYLNIMS